MKEPIRVEFEPEMGPDGKITAECIAKARGAMQAKLEATGDLSEEARAKAEKAIDELLRSLPTSPEQLVEGNREQVARALASCVETLRELPGAVQSLAMVTRKSSHIYELGRISGFINMASAILSTAIDQLGELGGCGCEKNPEAKKENAS